MIVQVESQQLVAFMEGASQGGEAVLSLYVSVRVWLNMSLATIAVSSEPGITCGNGFGVQGLGLRG